MSRFDPSLIPTGDQLAPQLSAYVYAFLDEAFDLPAAEWQKRQARFFLGNGGQNTRETDVGDAYPESEVQGMARPKKNGRYTPPGPKKSIRQWGAGALHRKAEPVPFIDDQLVETTERMAEIMLKARGVGLAGPQISYERRLFVVSYGTSASKQWTTVINPDIVERSDETCVMREGCLSVDGLQLAVRRPQSCHLVAVDINGEELNLELDGMQARVFQHEYDHLDGITMVERCNPAQREVAVSLLQSPGKLARLDLPLIDEDGKLRRV